MRGPDGTPGSGELGAGALEPSPFDAVAEGYDEAFTHRPLGRLFRRAVRDHLEEAFRPGERVLELGCGTGEDALWLAARGIRVTATDASEGMLEVAREKVRERGGSGESSRVGEGVRSPVKRGTEEPSSVEGGRGEGPVELAPLDLSRMDPPPQWPEGPFDGAYSGFGVLNCVEDRRAVFRFLADRIRPGGRVVAVVMAPVCPWEIGWHLARGRPGDAFRRLGRKVRARLGETRIRVWYPAGGRLRREAEPWFREVGRAGIGAFLPPPYLDPLAERWPRTFHLLARAEERWAGGFPWNRLCDHYLLVLRRR